ncbi:small membrane protein YohP [Geminicoccus flavidas]
MVLALGQNSARGLTPPVPEPVVDAAVETRVYLQCQTQRTASMLKFIGGTIGIIFLIGLLVVIGLLALIF